MPSQRPTPRFNPRGGDRRGQRQLTPRSSSSLWYGLAFLMILGIAQMYYLTPSGKTPAYSEFKQLVKDITLQIAAGHPHWVSRDQVPADLLAKEKEIAAEQVQRV